MSALIYHLFSSSSLVSLGLYHLISTTRNHLKSPQTYVAKPYHPLSSSSHPRLRNLQLHLLAAFLLIAAAHQVLISSDSDPLLRGGSSVHRFSSLQSAAVLLLFLILTITIIVSDSLLPSDLVFALSSGFFFLLSSAASSSASFQISDIEAKCDSVSSLVSALSSFLCLLLACSPRLFVADAGLGASLCLQGLWQLQTGLSLYVDAFIPSGCQKMLDVVSGVEGSTKCVLDESKLRAVAILDLLFLVHVMIVFVALLITYAVVAKLVGARRSGSYEALPVAADTNHIQMKALTGTQA